MADALRAVALGRCCRWRLLLLQTTRSPKTSASVAAASAGAASRRQMNSSSRPVVCSGGRPLSLSPQKTSSLLGGTFRSPGRAEKRKVVLPFPSLSHLAPLSIRFMRQLSDTSHGCMQTLRCGGGSAGSHPRGCWGADFSVRLLHSFLTLALFFLACILSQG